MNNLAPPEHDAHPRRLTNEQARDLVLKIVGSQAESLLRTAYRHSACEDDAHDAYQRSMEILLRRAHTLDPDNAHKWIHVVVKHEAMEVRRARSVALGFEEVDLERQASRHAASPEEQVLGAERTRRATEALKRLKPQELRAMWLKALGHSYADAAGNETAVQRPQPIKIDNNAPLAPVGLVSPAPVSSVDRFAVHWSLPVDAGSPIAEAKYQVCQAGVCGAAMTAPSLTGVEDVQLPQPGDGLVRVWLRDSAGHEDPATAAQLALRYVPEPAAQPTPDPIGGGNQAPPPGGTPLPVGPPPSVDPPTPPATSQPAKRDPALRISSVRVDGRRVLVRGSISSRASGRVAIRFSATPKRGKKVALLSRATIRSKRFSATLVLPRRAAGLRAGTVAVTYAGDADTRPATRRSTVRWKP